jgi:hypothetical protein
MRARPREINIFNMSLLDILCGALGAFCFMMLVALPYYVVGKIDRAESQKRTEELLKDVEKLRERMSDPEQAEELRKLIDELQAQIKQLEGQLNQYAYENDQLKADNNRLASENNRLTNENARLTSDNSRLTAENNRLTSDNQALTAQNQQLQIEKQIDEADLATRKPFLILAMSIDPTQDLALFLEDEMIAGQTDKKKFANGTFDPSILVQTGWENDLTNIHVPRRGVTLWISSTTRPQSSYRLFVRYVPHPDDNTPLGHHNLPTRVNLNFVGAFTEHPTPWVTLAPERPWVLAGTLKIDDKGRLSYKEASEAERDESWRTIMKSEVPTPAPTATPRTLDNDEMERLRKQNEEERRKFEELRLRRQQQEAASPGATNSPTSEDELRLRRERALRELQLRSPSPAASPP